MTTTDVFLEHTVPINPLPPTLPDITGQLGDQDDLASTNQQEGEAMKYYRFMVSTKTRDPQDPTKIVDTYYVFTTSIFADANEEAMYEKSLRTNTIVNEKMLAIKPGSYKLRLMEEQALAQGLHFRACVVSSKSLATINNLKMRANRHTVFWATEENATFLALMPNFGQPYFDQSLVIKDFGFDALGIDADYDEKMTKRYQEILRSTDKNIHIKSASEVEWTTVDELWSLDRTLEDLLHPRQRLVIAEFKTPTWKTDLFGEDAVMIYDGANVVDAEVLMRALEEQPRTDAINKDIGRLWWAINRGTNPIVGRFTFRLFGLLGLIKGDCLVVVGLKARTGADVIYHTENLKPKMRTRGWTVINFVNHHPEHVVNWDVQSPINFRHGLSEAQQLDDLRRFGEWADAVIADPEPPKWVTHAQEWHSEDDDDSDEDGASSQVGELGAEDYVRYQAYRSDTDWRECRDTRESQNFPALWINIATKKMDRGYNSKTQFYDKPFIPMSNAVNVGLMTYSVLEDMALLDCSHMDHSVSHFMENVGMLWSDERHIKTFELAGTKDLDDTSNAAKRRVFCSDPAYLINLIEDGVIAPCTLPTTAEEAVGWTGNGGYALIIRQPNGQGEWSMEWVAEDFPFYNTTEVDKVTEVPIPVLDLAKMSRGITHLIKALGTPAGLGSDPNRLAFVGQPFKDGTGRAQAHYILEAQAMNPGIGMVCNTLMLWTMATGSTLPSTMKETLGNMVDGVQQGHDKVVIGSVNDQPGAIIEELANVVRTNPRVMVDTCFTANRFRGIQTDDMKEIRRHRKADRPTRLSKVYRVEYERIMNQVKKRINAMRNATPLAQAVARMSFTNTTMLEAEIRFTNLYETLKQYDSYYVPKEVPGMRTPTFAVMNMRQTKAAAVKALIEKASAELMAFDERDRDLKILAMYKFAITPSTRWPNSPPDRCIFQSGGAETALFDLLAQAISRRKDRLWAPGTPDPRV